MSERASLSLLTGILLGPEELLSWSAQVFNHILILEDIPHQADLYSIQNVQQDTEA